MTVVDVNIRKKPQHKAEMDNTDIIVTSLTKVQLSGYAYQMLIDISVHDIMTIT